MYDKLDKFVVIGLALLLAANGVMLYREFAPAPEFQAMGDSHYTSNAVFGVDGTGVDLTFYSDTSGDYGMWDSSAEALIIVGTNAQDALDVNDGNVDIADDLDVDGTANFDATDFDGNMQLDGTLTVGTSGSGQDVIFHSATGSDQLTWDASEEALVIVGTNAQDALDVDDGNVDIADDIDVDGTANLDDVDIDLSAALNIDGHVVNIGGGTPDTAAADDDLYVTGDLEVDTNLDVDGVMNLIVGTEHIGVPTIHSLSITYTAAAGGSGTVATIADGEIWIVHGVWVRTTTTFDCTGDDETLDIGDGNDPDGFIDAAHTQLDSTFTEATGYATGWFGLENGSNGAYTLDDGNAFIYAPSGGDETIDWLLDETSGETITAGAATIYVYYTRIQ